MHRLFVAIRPPAAVRSVLLEAMGGISGARWQRDDQLHLTLRFIGEVDRHLAGDIHAALGAVHQPTFEIALNGIGHFERRGWPDAVWAGITPHDPLHALHKKVDAALSRVGVAPDQRAFLRTSRLPAEASSGTGGNDRGSRRPHRPAVHRRSFRPLRERSYRGRRRLVDHRALSARLEAGASIAGPPSH